MKAIVWIFWGLLTVALGGYYTYQFIWAKEPTPLLIGDASHGHFQIELACSSCHSDPFGGPEVLQDACVNCHGAELEVANDAHPKSKFTNPRNADRVEILDARYCVTCHTEHQRESTLAMGVTLPDDYCFYCHQTIFEDRPSHEGMAFDTCASAGCHNFHDNRALYEDFLLQHSNEPNFLASMQVPARQLAALGEGKKALVADDADADVSRMDAVALLDWAQTVHAKQGINCSDCHQPAGNAWIEKPGIDICSDCHDTQVKGFVGGKHGMRLAPDLSQQFSAVAPKQSFKLDFKTESLDQTHGCNSCHGAHRFDTQVAAVESCLGCHDDQHSLAFPDSPHGQLWSAELDGTGPVNTGVSCATCHMPREPHVKNGQSAVSVQHNQNANLRPNEKMLRGVCMNCHGLGFAIDSLADPQLILNNFNGQPSNHVPSIDMAVERSKTSH